MSSPNDPAYPTDRRTTENYMDAGGYGRSRKITMSRGGMTIRQRFVMAAMQGLAFRSATGSAEWVAAEAVRLADAALAEEARTRGKT